jgi:hypothetical protein
LVVLHEELSRLCADDATELPPLPVSYVDFAVWQRSEFTRAALAPSLGYWRRQLGGPVPAELRTDRPRPPRRDPSGAIVAFTVVRPVADAVVRLGRRRGATPFMTLLTLWLTVMARHSGCWDVPVGTPVTGRSRPEVDRVVGYFLNTLVLRCRLSPELSLDQALDRVRDTCRDAFRHQHVPFEWLVEELMVGRDPARTPLYQVMFDVHEERLTGLGADFADVAAFRELWVTAKTDLTLELRRAGDGGLRGVLEYSTALFDAATARRLTADFSAALEAVIADPSTTLGTIAPPPPAQDDRHDLQPPREADAITPPPRTVLLERVAEIWSQVLGSTGGEEADFFTAGGNSVLAIRLVSSLRSAFGVDVTLRSVFDNPTVAGLASAIEALIRAEVIDVSDAQLGHHVTTNQERGA